MRTKKIVIWGAGWLGLPLAKSLQSVNNQVVCITRSPDKKEYLRSINIDAVSMDELIGNPAEVEDCNVLIVSVPPSADTTFYEALDFVLKTLPINAQVIYTSSTGIYKNKNGLVDENSEIETTSKVYQTEQFLLTRKFNKITILRLGGLIGPKRHPVHYLAKNTINSCPHQLVNLIQQKDVIDLIQLFIETKITGVFNVCSAEHPTRQEYYTLAAKTFNLGNLLFEMDVNQTGKVIDTRKLIELFPTYTFTSIYDFEKCK